MSTVEDFERQLKEKKAKQDAVDYLYGMNFLTLDRLGENSPLVLFVIGLVLLVSMANLAVCLQGTAAAQYQAWKRVRWAPSRAIVVALLLLYALSANGAATILAILKPEVEELHTMLSFTLTTMALAFFLPSYLVVKDLSLALLTLLVALLSIGYQLYLFSEFFFLSAYTQVCTLVIVLYLTSILMRQWVATELAEALKMFGINAPPQLAAVLEGNKKVKRRPNGPARRRQ